MTTRKKSPARPKAFRAVLMEDKEAWNQHNTPGSKPDCWVVPDGAELPGAAHVKRLLKAVVQYYIHGAYSTSVQLNRAIEAYRKAEARRKGKKS